MERNPASNRTATIFFQLCFFLLITTFLFTSFASPVFATRRTGQDQMSETGTRYVYPVGKTVGIKLFSDGVLVIGTSDIKTQNGDISPAKACGLQEGDIITHINSKEVNSIEEVQEIVQQTADGALDVQILRDNTESNLTTKATQCSTDGAYKLGAWIRDSMAGIGTMTFYDPEENIFGTLGHGINDIDTSQLMPLESGAIMPSSVANVSKGLSGSPGQLHGSFEIERDLGALYANTNGGVFGTLSNKEILNDTALVPLAKNHEVKEGKATIRCNVTGEEVEEFEVKIIKLMPDSKDTRHLMLEVTDPRLLELTGGIVQGMSGSPILQDGKLVGAVTHVLLNEPKRGYGIFAEEMLTIAQNSRK